MVSDLLSSLVMALTLSNDTAWSTKSAQAETGSFASSNTVPVTGEKRLPQALQAYRWSPLRSLPFRMISRLPQCGQSSRGYPL